jgi:hypothetical protein
MKSQIVEVAQVKGAVTQNSLSLFGWEFNFYGLFLLAALILFVFLLWKAQRNKRLDWVDLITKDGVTVSLTKILQLVGGFVGTWIVVQMTIAGDMTWDILAVYLAYVASIESFSKFIIAKYRAEDRDGRGGGYYGGGGRGYGGGGGRGYGGGYGGRLPPPRSGNEADDEAERLRGGAAKPDSE